MNEVSIIDRSGTVRHVPMLTKDEIAHISSTPIKKVLKKRSGSRKIGYKNLQINIG